MSVQQISVFLESQPGHLSRVLDAFVAAKVSVRGYSASDTGDYGIVRFIVDDPERAMQVLQELGAAATTAEVLCVRLDDKPGELARVMGIMACLLYTSRRGVRPNRGRARLVGGAVPRY